MAGVSINLIDRKYLNRSDYIIFSLAVFASSAISGLAQGYLLFFYTSTLNIDVKVTALMFLIAKIWDGVNDPIMGVLVDRTRTKWGKMRPYLILGSIPFGAAIIILFFPYVAGLPMTGRIVYMYVTYLIYELISTVVGVPLQGLPAVVSPNTNERTKIISISRILGSIGEQSALVLTSIFVSLTHNNIGKSYFYTALIIGILAPAFMVLSGFKLKERIEPTDDTPNILDGFKYLFQNKPFLILISSNLLTFFRNLVSAMINFIVAYIYLNSSLQIWFALPGAAAAMLGMLLAPLLKKRMDAKQLFIAATIWHSAALAIVFALGYKMPWPVIAAAMFVAMLPVGILNVVPTLMAADTLDYWEYKTGKRQEGMTFALMSLRSKVSSGLKDFVLSYLLLWVGWTTAGNGIPIMEGSDLFQQEESVKFGLFMIFTIIPAVTNLVSILPMLAYTLTGRKLKEIQEELAERREQEHRELFEKTAVDSQTVP